jgi:hypothetical protein
MTTSPFFLSGVIGKLTQPLRYCMKILKFNPSSRDPALGFTEMATLTKPFATLNLFSGPAMISQEPSGRLVYWDVRSPDIEAELQGIPPVGALPIPFTEAHTDPHRTSLVHATMQC